MKLENAVTVSDIIPDGLALRYPIATALSLSLAAAIALGISRFSYGLLMPPMRDDLAWSYLLAGGMNTGNALGYFIGVLATPFLMRRIGVWSLLIAGSLLAGLFMIMSGIATDDTSLFLLRIFSGVVSSFVFIAGGILSARLASMHSSRAGFLIGLYYGGTGFGIVLSALLVPSALAYAHTHNFQHIWQLPWILLGLACIFCTAILAFPAKQIGEAQPDPTQNESSQFKTKDFSFSLSSYFMFGVGYIGYMTFVIALLNERGMDADLVTLFYSMLGLAVVASSRIWAGMLDHFKGGESLAILNTVLGIACILPAVSNSLPIIFISGIAFGAVFLSVVASTTALVRHNLAQESWSAGISAFTGAFAFGQIVGPTMVGWIADTPGGLEYGLLVSAGALFIAAALATKQKNLTKK